MNIEDHTEVNTATLGLQPSGLTGMERVGTTLSRREWLFLSALAIALLLFWSSRITGAVIQKDAADTLRMALNFKQTGVVSNSEQPPYGPSMFREPLPVFTTVLSVYVIEGALGRTDASQYFNGERAKLLKYQNVFWLSVLCGALFIIVRRLTGSFYYAVASILITNVLLLFAEVGSYMLNSLYTEAPAAALLAVGSLLLSTGIRAKRAVLITLAGLCFGLLALVKAAFLYVVPGIVLAIAFASLLNRQHFSAAVLVRRAVLLGLAFFIVVAPWMCRNYVSLGTFGIASRGGEALYIRAVTDQMTWEEYFGSFSVWAPYPLGGALRRILGISREDIENGVRLQRLNDGANSKWADSDLAAEAAGRPQDARTFYRQCGAERNKLIQAFTAAGHPQPGLATDRVLGKQGMQMIATHPLRHLAHTISELWRGAFFTFPLLLIAITYAWRRKNLELGMLLLPAFVMTTFYGLLAPFDPRYGLPAYPIAVCVAVVLGRLLCERVQSLRLTTRPVVRAPS
jgi:hypothetical protein